MQRLFVLLLAVALGGADVYLHNPRGSNNRLNEKSANRANANRVFDSQNNNRGGYNAGDLTDKAARNDEEKQYRMKYFMSGEEYKVLQDGLGSTRLAIEWTNQHGCGGNEDTDPHKQNCQVVLQYMCQKDVSSATGSTQTDTFRNGVSTNTQNYKSANKAGETSGQRAKRRAGDRDLKRGEHESWYWYDSCYVRERNGGLFTADQKLEKNKLGYSSAIHTRQNPNGNRRGYECPEERDYYPYFHSSPWRDIAVLTTNTTLCSHYREHSFNVKSKFECVELQGGVRMPSRWNTEAACTANGGAWTELFNYLEKATDKTNQNACERASSNGILHQWAVPYDTQDGTTRECLVKLDAPECSQAPWSRSNHLGNSRDGVPVNYTWTLPYFPSEDTQRCVFRIRYNISTDDYDPYRTGASHNENMAKSIRSPIEQNPYIEIGGYYPLRLAINTAQFGRTFEDRSHVFKLMSRPALTERARIHNLNVRGKRGNIVQVYPAVEYDFVPNDLSMLEDDFVHIQWTGSNTHDNNSPGGDGQTGDAGEGTGGTDRNNIVEVRDLNENYPVPFENSSMWESARVVWIHSGLEDKISGKDLATTLASSGYFQCFKSSTCGSNSLEKKSAMNSLLNNAPASFEGVLVRFGQGTYHYICSRNNNFTNRSQKGTIRVKK